MKLKSWLKETRDVQKLAKYLDTTDRYIHMMANGERAVTLKYALKIVKFTNGKVSFKDLLLPVVARQSRKNN